MRVSSYQRRRMALYYCITLLLVACCLPARLIEVFVTDADSYKITGVCCRRRPLPFAWHRGMRGRVGGRWQHKINAKPLISWTILDRQLTIVYYYKLHNGDNRISVWALCYPDIISHPDIHSHPYYGSIMFLTCPFICVWVHAFVCVWQRHFLTGLPSTSSCKHILTF